MKIEKVTYIKTFSSGPYLTDKVGFEASLDETDIAEEVLTDLKKWAEDWHKQAYPWLYTTPSLVTPAGMGDNPYTNAGVSPSIAGPFTLPTIDKSIERLEIEIDNAKTLEELRPLKEEAAKSKEGTTAYMRRLKQLGGITIEGM